MVLLAQSLESTPEKTIIDSRKGVRNAKGTRNTEDLIRPIPLTLWGLIFLDL